jgi:putative methyltransferase (TIGR04325 family)
MIKNVIKQVTPPIIWNALRKRLAPSRPAVTYEGQFKSFEEVRRQYPESTNYHSPASEAEEFDQAAWKLKRFESGELPEEGITLHRLNFLPTLLSFHFADGISVLDVGGGLGVSFIDLMFSLPGKPISMTVLELPATAAQGRELFHAYKDISFVDSLPGPDAHFDVVYFGSSLQYFEDYRGFLKRITDLKPEIVAISDTTMGDAAAFVAAQVNMAGRVIPRLVFNLPELVRFFSSNGYALLHKSLNHSDFHNFANYEPPISGTGHWNLVFRRLRGLEHV